MSTLRAHKDLIRKMPTPELCDAISAYVKKRLENEWRKIIPACVWADPEAHEKIIQPACEVEAVDEFINSFGKSIKFSWTVPDTKNFGNGNAMKLTYEFSTRDIAESDPVAFVHAIIDRFVEEYQNWCVGFYLDAPPGCLVVWDDEILPKESAKAYNLLRGEGTVRPKLGIMLMEDEHGAVSVQLIQDPKQAKESFDQLTGRPGEKPQRATLLALDYDGSVVEAATKMLPVSQIKEQPDMHVLGTGPVKFKEGWKKELKESFKEFTQ